MRPTELAPNDPKITHLHTFAEEYVRCGNATTALLRMGEDDADLAYSRGKTLLKHPEVNRHIKTIAENLESNGLISKSFVLNVFAREANYYGKDGGSATRIKAADHLAKVLGMYQAEKVEVTVAPAVMEVPLASEEDWELASTTSQARLIDHAQN